MNRWTILGLAALVILAFLAAGDITEEQKVIIVYSGDTTIKDALATKYTDVEQAAYLSAITDEKVKPLKFPYFIADDKLAEKTVIAVNGYRCNNGKPPAGEPANMCGYWIAATKDKKVVATNSPVWIYPPPYQVVVSEITNADGSITVTVAEDPQTAFERVIMQYVDRRPLGPAIVTGAL